MSITGENGEDKTFSGYPTSDNGGYGNCLSWDNGGYGNTIRNVVLLGVLPRCGSLSKFGFKTSRSVKELLVSSVNILDINIFLTCSRTVTKATLNPVIFSEIFKHCIFQQVLHCIPLKHLLQKYNTAL